MDLRLATTSDLPQLKEMYEKIIDNMSKNNICIWDEVYPYTVFSGDIENRCLYVLTENGKIASAFTLYDFNAAEDYIQWKTTHKKVFYMGRLGVNVDYLKRGVGKITLDLAISIARESSAEYLRLFVAAINKPALDFYMKNGFEKAEGIYYETMNDGRNLPEFGFEMKI